MPDLSITSDADLLSHYAAWLGNMETARVALGHLEQEILRRTRERGATVIESPTHKAEIVPSVNYDQSRLLPLLERLSEADLKDCWEQEWVEQVKHAARFNLTRLKKVARQRGKEIQWFVDDATVQAAPKVRFSVKEAP